MRFLKGLLLALFLIAATHAEDFLSPEDAFRFSYRLENSILYAQWDIQPGYYLYRDSIKPFETPKGEVLFDTTLNKQVEKLQGVVQVEYPVTSDTIEVTYQGCAKAGLCYPPQSQRIEVDKVAQVLGSGSIWKISVAFLVLGVLLSFTPCVLPMVPILSSIILGYNKNITKLGGLGMSALYSLGMALVYTALGIAAGLLGESLAAALQNPVVLLVFGGMLILLALSMFDVYTLQVPSFIQTKLQIERSGLFSIFVMGALSALVVGPCVAAPLAGALIYISKTKDVVIGGLALFSLAIGMSVPLLLTGLSAGSLLPKAGKWMKHIKTFFGVLLIATALWIMYPALSQTKSREVPEITSTGLVMIDFYADWCVACKEYENFTFKDIRVRERLSNIKVIKVDVTENTPEVKAILKQYELFGPPAIIFIKDGKEIKKIIGYKNAEDFATILDSILKI